MSEEKEPNWLLAGLTLTVIVAAAVALAIPSLRVVGGCILFAYWAAICALGSYTWYGSSIVDVRLLLGSGIALLVFAAYLWPTGLGFFLAFLGAANLLHAWWRNRRLKEAAGPDS